MIQKDFSINARMLDLLYRQIAPERVLEAVKQCYTPDEKSFLDFNQKGKHWLWDNNLFNEFAETVFEGYSENEQKLIYNNLAQDKHRWEEKSSLKIYDLFLPVLKFAESNLTIFDGYPVCRSESVLLWRNVYLALGQDMFTCAYLAFRDLRNGIIRTDYTWPLVLHTDNRELYQMLGQGLAENHNHLGGGTQSFPITWCCLMNDPRLIRTELTNFYRHKSDLLPKMVRGGKYKILDVMDRLELAALIRSILFEALLNKREADTSLHQFAAMYLNPFSFQTGLYQTVDRLRYIYGAKIVTPENSDFCLDYALTPDQFKYCADSDLRVIVGERYFLYRCFQAGMRPDGLTEFENHLLYFYLVLKCNFRSEMIQNNNQVGFQNFQHYQDRKDDAFWQNSYFWEAARIAVHYRMENESLLSLEGRMSPNAAAEKNLSYVMKYDRANGMDNPRYHGMFLAHSVDPNLEIQPAKYRELRWFYVFHFIKGEDNRMSDPSGSSMLFCRNINQRKKAENEAKGMMKALQASSYLRCRLRGIDASSDEYQCRPEVFAKAYRYISEEQKNWDRNGRFLPQVPICISKTYHVGEDFLDLADGIRAIDEAVEFLEMGAGSRIGHALALGVEPDEHYCTKHYEPATTKQDRLDDLVWLLFRSWELGVSMDRALEAKLKREAELLFDEIYGEAANDCSLEEYWRSMHLRGDDPACYRTKRYRELWSVEDIDRYRVRSDRQLEMYRNDPHAARLYYYYHYGVREGARGGESYYFKVEPDYMVLMYQIQTALMREINEKQIVIECNPSSNVLIGTFREYGKHPIFRFNNRKLVGKHSDDVQLNVCVNTDDLGVFDTSLDFEYALLYSALREERDENGMRMYSDRDIIEYLDDLRKMGLRAVFPGGEV